MAIFRKSGGKLIPVKELNFDLEKHIQKLTEDNLENIFDGLEFVKSEFQLGQFRIDTLAFDKEAKSFVIIEYKRAVERGLFEQGLAYMEILLDRGSDFITEYNEQLNKSLRKSEVDKSQSRVIFVSPSFDKFQKQASNLDLHIELWEVSVYENNLVEFTPIISESKTRTKLQASNKGSIGKIQREIKTYSEEHHLLYAPKMTQMYKELKEKILGLGDNMKIVYRKNYIAFRTTSGTKINFVAIAFQKNSMDIYMAGIKPNEIEDPKKIVQDVSTIGHPTSGLSRVRITKSSEIPYLFGLVEQSYRKSVK